MGLLTDKNMTKTEKQRILGSGINRGHMGGSKNMGTPNGWFILMENPIEMDEK